MAVLKKLAWPLFISAFISTGVEGEDFRSALERAREAEQGHKYLEVVEILSPFNNSDNPEIQYITSAEIGRAHFHLGKYKAADREFRRAVQIHPNRVETALYLEATSFLLGDRAQALLILREVLKSGARDLYLAVTLPGERFFLSDPEVAALIDEYAVMINLDLKRGSLLGVSLGDPRSQVVDVLQATSKDSTARSLSANAGPHPIWTFIFGEDHLLEEIILYTDSLQKYTPYRLNIGDELDRTASPASAIAAFGAPAHISTEVEKGIIFTWEFGHFELTLDFGEVHLHRPQGKPEGAAILRALRLRRKSTDSTISP